MKAKDKVIMDILTNAFGNKIPEGAFRAVTDAYKAGIKEMGEWIKTERKCKYINDVTYYPVYEKALEAKLKE